MKIVKNFVVTSKDLRKIMERGCRICRSNEFKSNSVKEYASCINCGAKYYIASEGLLDEFNKQFTSVEVYRSGSTIGDIPPYNSEIEVKRVNYRVREKDNKYHSTR